MNQWTFVIAAYVVVLVGTMAVLVHSYASMRRAEHKADQLSKRK